VLGWGGGCAKKTSLQFSLSLLCPWCCRLDEKGEANAKKAPKTRPYRPKNSACQGILIQPGNCIVNFTSPIFVNVEKVKKQGKERRSKREQGIQEAAEGTSGVNGTSKKNTCLQCHPGRTNKGRN